MRTIEEIQKDFDGLQEKIELLKIPLPEPIEPYEGQYENLRKTVMDYVTHLLKGNHYTAIDFERWICQQAITAVYGKDIWKTIRRIQK